MPAAVSCNGLIAKIRSHSPNADLDLVRLAFDYAEEAHRGQMRASGEPYIVHSLKTAEHLAEMGLPAAIVVAGLLHDVPEDTDRTAEDIRREFGADVAAMVAGITKLGKIKYRGIDRYVENLRKMFVAMASDIRVILIKFADRMHNLETLDSLPPAKRDRIAFETLEIFSPIANRLGMYEIKGQLEDLAFRHALPEDYAWTAKLSREVVRVRSSYIVRVRHLLRKRLRDAGVPFLAVDGRVKRLYSLYRKLLKYDRDISRIHDLIALRVIVPTVGDCYAALGAIHQHWKPLKGRIKDYIAVPKPNGYRSLHTTVYCEDGEIVEFQIRTEEMHEAAERGIAAHWRYDEDGKRASAEIGRQMAWVRDLSGRQPKIRCSDGPNGEPERDGGRIDVFRGRIFVFTPQGDVIDLPDGATPVDFAYAIHTQIGHTCTGARINDQIAGLNALLSSGDVCDIITDKNRRGPNPDWLNFVVTPAAKGHIRTASKSRLTAWLRDTAPSGRLETEERESKGKRKGSRTRKARMP